MMDFAEARKMMVEGQIRTNQITDPKIVNAMLALPRERFVPSRWQQLAYTDRQIELTDDGARCSTTPMVLGKLVSAAGINPGDKVLHVGAGLGYGSAVIAALAGQVFALEEDATLAQAAGVTLGELGITNVTVVTGSLSKGLEKEGPFDVIIIEGSVDEVPEHFAAQLADDGRLVAIVGAGRAARGTLFRKAGGGLSGYAVFDAAAPRLPGFEKPPAFVF